MDLYIVNLTASAQLIEDLGITIPASGNIQALPDLDLEEVHKSDDLYTFINTDILILSYDGVTNLTKQDSLDLLVDVSKEHIDETEYVEDARNTAMKEPTGFENRFDSVISFDNGNRRFSIQPTATEYSYYIYGKRYVKTGLDSVDIDDTTGLHYIYIEGSILKSTMTGDAKLILGPWVFVSTVYWDSTIQESIGLVEERHGLIMSGSTHQRFHLNIGPTWSRNGFNMENYLLEENGNNNDHTQFSLTDGKFEDEDMEHDIVHADTPSNPFEQVLNHVTEHYAAIPVLHMIGPKNSQGAGVWKQNTAQHSPLKWNASTSHIQYNYYNSDTEEWELIDVPYGRYIAVWIFATNDQNQPIKAVLGQKLEASLDAAKLNNSLSSLNIGDLHYRYYFPFLEPKILYRLIYRAVGNATNDFKATLMHQEDLRETTFIGAASATFALASQVAEVESVLGTSLKNVMLNSLEIALLKQTDLSPDFSYFIDTFADDSNIDPESTNYVINEQEGYASLEPEGNYSVKDTTKAQFDEGTYTDSESYIGFGGDGALRKYREVAGTIVTVEDFEEISNVNTIGAAVQAQSSTPGTFQEGEKSLAITVDFSGASLTETAETEIEFYPLLDLSIFKSLRLYYLKQGSGAIKYDIEIEDGATATYAFSQQILLQANVYQIIEKELATATGIDKSQIKYIRFRLYEQATGQVLLDLAGTGQTNTIYDGREGKQTFLAAGANTCGRIRLRVKWASANQPTAPLYIGLANVFDTTLGVAVIQPTSATTAFQDFYLTFDNAVNFIATNQYGVLIRSETTNTNAWAVETASDFYYEGAYFQNGGDTNRDLNFTLYTPAIHEAIYIDNLETEAESTYKQTATFVSHAINLGIVPDTLNMLWWTEEGTVDTVQLRVRFADSEGNLPSAPWSSYYSDPTGVGNNLTGLTPNSWFQYEVTWTGGPTNDTNIIKDVTLEYSTTAGTGSAIIISTAETTELIPDQFLALWSDVKGSGSVDYYISRDGKTTWQAISEDRKGKITSFENEPGQLLHLKAVLTGNARLYNWALACNKEFV